MDNAILSVGMFVNLIQSDTKSDTDETFHLLPSTCLFTKQTASHINESNTALSSVRKSLEFCVTKLSLLKTQQVATD